jgi:F-type H+-transporting ATPase subunit b
MHFDQTFWVGLSFIAFAVLAWKPVAKFLVSSLDNRSIRVQTELAEAQRLKEEAQSLLASYQQKQSEMRQEAVEIMNHATEEAKRIVSEAETNLEVSLNKRIELSMQKIASYESSVIRDIHNRLIDTTIHTVEQLLGESLDKNASDVLIQNALEGINKKLH